VSKTPLPVSWFSIPSLPENIDFVRWGRFWWICSHCCHGNDCECLSEVWLGW
jgi:hypothetical protein